VGRGTPSEGWELRYDRVVALGLEDRIVPHAGAEGGPSI
jgi:hypothetical protein